MQYATADNEGFLLARARAGGGRTVNNADHEPMVRMPQGKEGML